LNLALWSNLKIIAFENCGDARDPLAQVLGHIIIDTVQGIVNLVLRSRELGILILGFWG
jgi:hypothetical protein